MNDQIIIYLLIGLIGLLAVSLICITYFFISYIKNDNKKSERGHNIPKVSKRKKEDPEENCKNHEDVASQATCAICLISFCDNCILTIDDIHFCKEHVSIYTQSQWTEAVSIKTTPDEPEKGLKLYQLKESLWPNEKIPTIIQTHYKIDVDNDIIESHVKLLVQEDQKETILKKYKNSLN